MQVERTFEPSGRRVRAQSAAISTGYVAQPWKSLHEDTLRLRGDTNTDAQGATTCNAPGLEVRSSPAFLEDHCLRLVKALGSTGG